jgi:hypothetical protein
LQISLTPGVEGREGKFMPTKKKNTETKKTDDTTNIEPGMVVEATKGDLGEEDVSKPKVTEVVQDQQGNVDKLIVDVSKNEAASLTSIGTEALESEQQNDILDKVEQEVPTAEGLRELEARNSGTQAKQTSLQSNDDDTTIPHKVTAQHARRGEEESHPSPAKKTNFLLRVLGPGFLAGMAGNDASAVATYAIDGATNGYGHLWLLLLSTPLYQAVQFACAKIGRITQKGLADILREHYSRWIAIPASLILIVANIALIAADLVAIGSGLELITGVSWVWFVIPVGVILWYLTVYRNFETIKKIFIVMSLALTNYPYPL